jgi:hypothetical protein
LSNPGSSRQTNWLHFTNAPSKPAHLHIMHQGNDELLSDIRQLWKQPLILNGPGQAGFR